MIEGMPQLPYEVIGRAAFLVVAGLTALLLGAISYIVGTFIWYRLFGKLINLCWYGYEFPQKEPPYRRRKLAIIFHCLKYRNFSQYEEKVEKLDKVTDKNET